jgi:hypothetical protein
MRAGTDVAIEAADVTLVRDDVTAAADAVRLARRTLRVIEGNLFWALANAARSRSPRPGSQLPLTWRTGCSTRASTTTW